MKTRFTKFGAVVLAMVLCITAVLGNGSTAKAAEDYITLLEIDSASASAYTPVSHVKKSKLNVKKADLINASCTGSYYYYY